MNNILVVDDDYNFQKIITELLESEGYVVDATSDPINAFELYKNKEYDLVITDLKMESITGLQLLSMIRRISLEAKVIIITGSNSIVDEINGLELDVDEYIQKPFSFEVFLKRIERVIKKEKVLKYKGRLISTVDNIEIDLDKREVKQADKIVDLTRKEYDLLSLFLSNKNKVLEREFIIENLWNEQAHFVDTRSVDTHVKNLRAKMTLTCIYSMRGIGYEWLE